MSGIVTYNFSIETAKKFKAALDSEDDYLYLFIGRIEPWANEQSVPAQSNYVGNVDYDVWRDMFGLKRIIPGGISLATNRYNWSNNTLFTEYDHTDTNIFSSQYFVLSSANNVYKCLFNNSGANSTVEPTGTSTSVLTTADGYKWKFMYSLSSDDITDFVSTNYIPVKTLTADDSSLQWDVQQAAVNGSIQVIDVTTGGSGYVFTSNTLGFNAVSNSTTLVLRSNASGTDDIYNGSVLRITGGAGSGQQREIINYVGSTRTATVNAAFTSLPNTSSPYLISPKVTIYGDGTGATAYSNVVAGAISYVNIINEGSDYSTANVVITANSGSGAVATAYIPQNGGHGSNPVQELNGKNLMFNVTLERDEANTLPIVNDYRRFGLILNPKWANGSLCTTTTVSQTTKLNLSSVSSSGSFVLDSVVTGETSGATGRIVRFSNTNSSNTSGNLHVVLVSSNIAFSTGETVTSSGANGIIDSITAADLKPYSGEVIYIENRQAISRARDQDENFKLVFTF